MEEADKPTCIDEFSFIYQSQRGKRVIKFVQKDLIWELNFLKGIVQCCFLKCHLNFLVLSAVSILPAADNI